MDLGTLPKAGKGEVVFWLHNPGADAVEITRIETSCPCLQVELAERVIEPAKKVKATARVDFSAKPDFAGALRLEATGFANVQSPRAFMAFVKVEVASMLALGGH